MTSLTVMNQTINTNGGLYSLTDLHKSAGGENKHKPSYFMANQTTKDLITEIESDNQIAYNTIIGKGKNQGTFVCRELVYAYAMWISAKFHLMVIRAFDSMNTGAIPVLQSSTVKDRTPLRQAVSALVGKCGLPYDEAYAMVHQYMGVGHIDEIAIDELPRAVAYVHSLMLHPTHTANHAQLYDVLADCYTHLRHYTRLAHYMHSVHADSAQDTLSDIVRLSQQMGLTNQYGRAMFERIGHERRLNYYQGSALIIR